MSYSIWLENAGDIIPFIASWQGIPSLDGDENLQFSRPTDPKMMIHYGLSPHFYNEIDENLGIRWLYGRRAADTTAVLAFAAMKLGAIPDGDHLSFSKGNAGFCLLTLLSWAIQYPSAIWRGN